MNEVWFIKVRFEGKKRWAFVTPKYTTNDLKIYAAMVDSEEEAISAATKIAGTGRNFGLDAVRVDTGSGKTVKRFEVS